MHGGITVLGVPPGPGPVVTGRADSTPGRTLGRARIVVRQRENDVARTVRQIHRVRAAGRSAADLEASLVELRAKLADARDRYAELTEITNDGGQR